MDFIENGSQIITTRASTSQPTDSQTVTITLPTGVCKIDNYMVKVVSSVQKSQF